MTAESLAEVPEFPMAREARCPFDPAPGLYAQREQGPLTRVRLVCGTLYRRIPTLKPATELDRVPFKHNGLVYGVFELPVTW
ncbi:hypothetical protein [Nonomuraea sp. NPDC049625]|uniref:hypothetical protein n=1 Tax=Nonomuraea sp. NPDC049625 TaxID=3155775 RepID=UPI0034256716